MEPELFFVKNVLDFECGSLVGFQLDENAELDSLNFQSDAMKTIFHKFPSVLLFCRTRNSKGKVLYTLFVDSPYVQVEVHIQKLVHIAVSKNESVDGLSRMLFTFKEFNPDWPSIKTVLVDPLFTGTDALAAAFPSAEIVLSAFHICKYFQKKIYQMSLEAQVERWLLEVLKNTMCSPTKCNLKNMYDMFNKLISPEEFPQFNCNWLLIDRIWDMHNWRSVPYSNQYFQSMEIVSHDLGKIFTNADSLKSSITSLAKYIQESQRNLKSADMVRSLAVHPEKDNLPACCSVDRSIQETPKVTDDSYLSSRVKVWYAKQKAVPEQEEQIVVQGKVEEEDEVQRSLQSICTEAAAKLCLKELAVALTSVRLVGASEDSVSVQILEDGHVVSKTGPLLCTCHFSKTFQLPCRHALAALKEEKNALRPEMIFEKWQKKDSDNSDQCSLEGGMLDVLQSSWHASEEKSFTVKFLTGELMRLIAECGTDEFESKYNTLRELADSWIGPYEQVKL